MSNQQLLKRIRSIEAQLEVLKAKIASSEDVVPPPTRFSDLYGIFADLGDLTLEEIKAAEYTIDLDEWPESAE